MCLSTVYALQGAEKKLLCKNVAAVSLRDDGSLVFTDIMGIPTVVTGQLEKIDLMDNFIFVRQPQ